VTTETGRSKVPERITAFFWIIKILTTATGESTSDYLVYHVNPYLAVVVGFVAFAIAIAIQFRARTYQPWIYWSAVLMVAVFGTMAADVVHIEFGVPYFASTAAFAFALAVVFAAWHASEKTLSIHSIFTRRRELFYWAAVLATFALGTATGDLTAYTVGLGFLASGLIFAVAFALPAIAYRFFGLNSVIAFWIAYVLTRPLGASFADWLGKSRHAHGLGFGDGAVSFVLIVVIIGFVAYVSVTRNDRSKPRSPRAGAQLQYD
jgi:uncharacterized membrane-anchored protein